MNNAGRCTAWITWEILPILKIVCSMINLRRRDLATCRRAKGATGMSQAGIFATSLVLVALGFATSFANPSTGALVMITLARTNLRPTVSRSATHM